MNESLKDNIEEIVNHMESSRSISDKFKDHIDDSLLREFEEDYESILSLIRDAKRQESTAKENKTIILFGHFSTGKTTLINALLNTKSEEVRLKPLPTRDDPTTAKPVRIKYDPNIDKKKARILYDNDETTNISIDEAYKLMGTESDDGKDAGIIEIQIITNYRFLSDFDLLDLPGTGTDYYEHHEKIVKSRLKDSSMILWVNGGPEEEYPNINDIDLIKSIIPDDRKKRPIIPVWNAKQVKGKPLQEDDKAEEFRNRAKQAKDNLKKDLTGKVVVEPIVVWAENANIDSSNNWRSNSNLNRLDEEIEKKISVSYSPIETAAHALKLIRDDYVKKLKNIRTIGWDTLENKKSKKRKIIRGLRKLDTFELDSTDTLDQESKEYASNLIESSIKPAINQFIDDSTSAGGVISEAWKAKHIKPEKFRKKLEENIEKSLLNYLPILKESNNVLDKSLSDRIDSIFNKLNRELTLFKEDIKDIFDLRDIKFADNGNKGNKEFMDKGSFVSSTKKMINERIGNISGAIITIIITTVIICLPKTGTPVDVAVAIVGFIGAMFSLKSFSRRMKGRVNLACWEISVRIKGAIKEPCNDQLQKTITKISNEIDISKFEENIEVIRSYLDELKKNISALKDIKL